ncbi:hypothetical protein McanMca71_007544 [Microsporum canis]|uniref:Uncharacterized protein n=1 Tax=Arthroderma otae (strain ATCC MYA-4605 / CBS 113480) TaxID=554155 RepID=C5FGB4_ARTOC|nr:uncharacterized protein MCYG_02618 [Microsporum canis CBS 113480]EEQ29799.1 predicted protein [Microsporum canis CBS 113480]
MNKTETDGLNSPEPTDSGPRTFLDPEGGTPTSAILDESVTKRRRQAEYLHRPPVWNIRPSHDTPPNHLDSQSSLENPPNHRDAGVQDACQFCLQRLPGPALSPNAPNHRRRCPALDTPATIGRSLRKTISFLRDRSKPSTSTIPPFDASPITNREVTLPSLQARGIRPDGTVFEVGSIAATDSDGSLPSKNSWSKLAGFVTKLPARLRESVRRRNVKKRSPYRAIAEDSLGS